MRVPLKDAMTLKFADYDGPTGLFVATGSQILPLESAAGAIAFVGSAMQSGIGDQGQAVAVQTAIDSALASAQAA